MLAAAVAIAQISSSDSGSLLAQAGRTSVGEVQGVVLTDEPQPRPIPKARVVVFRAFAVLPDIVWTDDNGRFSFPTGTTAPTTIRVSRSGFIAQFAKALGAGSDVEVRLVRAGVVTGRVVNERGEPVWGSTVQLQPEDPAQRASQAAAPLTTRTDDRGEFRFSSIKPGPYVVMKTPVDVVAGREATVTLVYGTANQNAASRAAGAISGRITDASGEPVEGLMVHPWEAQWADGRVLVRPLRIISTTDDRGRYRVSGLLPGTYYLGISDEVSNSHGPVNVVSARVFYPGVTSIAAASPLEIDTGTEYSGMDVVLDPPIGTRVIGSVELSTGESPKAGQVRFFADSRQSSGPVREAWIDALRGNGFFLFQDVPPGDYVVQVIAGSNHELLNEIGVATVTVGGRDTSSVVRTSPVSTLSGRVVFEGAPPPPLPAVTISPLSADVHTSPLFPSSLQKVELRPDWTFEIANLFGPTRIVATAPAGWWLKSVMLDGRNLADEPMTFGTGDRTQTGAEIVFVRNQTALTGTARERDRPIMDYSVVVYPTDAALQYPRSRHMTLVRSDPDGRFTVRNLPPGTYWVAAVDGVTGDASGGDWQSPELIALVTRSARRVTLDANRSISVDLGLTRLPRKTLQ